MIRDEELIARLAGDARPIQRVAPPLRRGSRWLAGMLAAAGIALAWLYVPGTMALRMTSGWSYVELAATLATGITAIFSAFNLGVPGDTGRWRWAPLPPLLLWMAATVAGLLAAKPAWGSEDGIECFRFVILAATPMAIAVIVALRRTMSLQPWYTAFLGGLGVASLATFLLAFCHPFALNPTDLAAHVAAMLLVIGLVTFLGGPALKVRLRR